MQLVDRRVLANKKRLERMATEERLLRVLDHTFLPTHFTGFDIAPHFSCIIMVFNPAGGLHSLHTACPSSATGFNIRRAQNHQLLFPLLLLFCALRVLDEMPKRSMPANTACLCL